MKESTIWDHITPTNNTIQDNYHLDHKKRKVPDIAQVMPKSQNSQEYKKQGYSTPVSKGHQERKSNWNDSKNNYSSWKSSTTTESWKTKVNEDDKPTSNGHIENKSENQSRKFSSPSSTSKPKNWFGKNISSPFKCSYNSRHSLNHKNVSYSPLQGYGQQRKNTDFRNTDYYEVYDYAGYGKNSLPNDSWHYQIQVQMTLRDDYNEKDKTLQLDLATFKTEKWKTESKHNPKHCKYYHSLKDRRRGHMNYSTDLCRFAETDKCLRGDKCFMSHSNVERLYHPDKYKTKFWDVFGHDVSKCEYGTFWSFAHVVSEIKIDLIHRLPKDSNFYMFFFKTEWCPFRKDHHKADCVYAHNWQDFRRKPHLFEYNRSKCDNWRSARYITKYSEGCNHMENWIHSHGWKEECYHPLSYMVHPCREK